MTNANGPITALSAGSLSGQTMTCSISPTSTLAEGFQVGNSVRMYCLNGALYQLKHNDTTPASTTTTTTASTTTTTESSYTYASGTIFALSSSSITVGSGDVSMTCSIGSSSPSTSGFAVGNSVGMYCSSSDGSLYHLSHR